MEVISFFSFLEVLSEECGELFFGDASVLICVGGAEEGLEVWDVLEFLVSVDDLIVESLGLSLVEEVVLVNIVVVPD